MVLSWYERDSDAKEYLLLSKRVVKRTRPHRMPHVHDAVELVFGLKGSSLAYVNGAEYPIEENCMLFIDSFERHNYDFIKGTECYVVLISPSYFDGINRLRSLSFPTLTRDAEAFARVKPLLDYTFSALDKDSPVFKSGFVNMLVSALVTNYPYELNAERAKHEEALLNAVRYVNENFREPITVEQLAKRFGYSKNYFSMLFNKYIGIGFRDYLNRCRISEYVNLRTSSPDLPSYKAAELCGFENLSTFYRAYKIILKDAPHFDDESRSAGTLLPNS